ncbi:MAG: hypothetical protein ACKVQW_09065 [Pyrinomonadaceae bacterium]
MTQKLLFVLCFMSATAAINLAQTQTVTNSDLEKYRQDRIKAETELRVNYARLGFPSPEEMARRNAQSAKEAEELSARLQKDELTRERLEAERAAAEYRAAQYYYRAPQQTQITPSYYDAAYTYYWWNGRRFRIPRLNLPNQQPGYFAGGQFWPTGPRTPSQPLFRVNPRKP